MKNFKTVIADFRVSQKCGFQYALFFALHLILFFNPISEENVAVKSFSRTFGSGIIHNWDCSRVISNFYFWIALFSILFFGFWILFNKLKESFSRAEEEKNAVSFLDGFMVLGCVNLALKAFVFFTRNGKTDYYSTVIVDFAIVSVFLYLIFHCAKNILFDSYLRLLISIFSFSFCIIAILKKTEIVFLIRLLSVVVTLSILLIKALKNPEKNPAISSLIKSSSVTFCFFPLMTSVYFELLNVLNAHNIFVTRIRKYYAVASILVLGFAFVLSLVIERRKFALNFWKRIAYPVLILGIAALSAQPALSRVYGADIFESANLSIPVSNFLNFGKLPVITCYPGHMMSGVWQAFLYAFLNGDSFGAIFSPYSAWLEFPVTAVLFFYFAKTVLNEDMALFAAIVFPFSASSAWNYFGLGMLLALAVMAYVKRQSLFRAFLIWAAFAWCALYRLNLGFAFFAATVVSLALWLWQSKNKIAAKQLFISLAISAFAGLLLWTLLCIQEKVNPVLRLFEFLKLSASNPTWAYNQIGDKNKNLFVVGYLLLPFLMALSVCFCAFSKKLQKSISAEHWILLLIFGFSYFFNMPRGLVRHSLAENSITIVFWSAAIFISAFLSAYIRKKNLFLPIFAFLIIFSNQFVNGGAFSASPIAESVLPQIHSNLEQSRAQKANRVIFEKKMQDWCDSYKFVMDKLLESNETYLDFMNRTFAYSAIGRENPVYVAQSPLMLSGEFTQKMFIKEIANRIETVPLAILPLNDSRASASLDGILNSYRYYKVSEFIFSHYRPLCKFGDFAVWARNERYDSFAEKLNFNSMEDNNLIEMLLWEEGFSLNNCEVIKDFLENSLTLRYTGKDPFLSNLHDFIDISEYVGAKVSISFEYETDTDGVMQLFYTLKKGEGYSEQNSAKQHISSTGTAAFSFPVSEYTHIRLDIPEKSTVKIKSIRLYDVIPIDAGYSNDFHSYNLDYLPLLWAEKDKKTAAKNPVAADLKQNGGIWYFPETEIAKDSGNYLLLKLENASRKDKNATVRLGKPILVFLPCFAGNALVHFPRFKRLPLAF